LPPEKVVINKVITARVSVIAMFPVRFAAPGSNPRRFPNQMKKKTVRRKGKYLSNFFSPMLSFAMSSLTKMIKGSKNA
jgi:hypothetical protein